MRGIYIKTNLKSMPKRCIECEYLRFKAENRYLEIEKNCEAGHKKQVQGVLGKKPNWCPLEGSK